MILIRFFLGTSNKPSMMRLLCFISVVWAFYLMGQQPENTGALCTVIIVALAGKWLQRGSENDK